VQLAVRPPSGLLPTFCATLGATKTTRPTHSMSAPQGPSAASKGIRSCNVLPKLLGGVMRGNSGLSRDISDPFPIVPNSADRKTAARATTSEATGENHTQNFSELQEKEELKAQHEQQLWLDRRLCGLCAFDFDAKGVYIFVTAELRAPPGFEQAFSTSDGQHAIPHEVGERLQHLQAVLIFSDPFDMEQVSILRELVIRIDSLQGAPPMVWVQHTVAPEARKRNEVLDPARHKFVSELLELGIDGIIPEDCEGVGLICALKGRIRRAAIVSHSVTELVNERRERFQYGEFINGCIDAILWDYVRTRLALSIPAVDHSIPPGDVIEFNNFKLTDKLGQGMFGSVFKICMRGACAKENSGQVMKVLSKRGIRCVQDLKALKRTIDVMQRISAPKHVHPNISQLYQVYSSVTHIFFRMEDGGPENLYRRLSYRQKEGPRNRPMSLWNVRSLLVQAIRAIAHLHTKVHICHRDIKPENIIIFETNDTDLALKLADFDLAVIQEEGSTMCRNMCGTMPFTAPEVCIEKKYDGQLADIWSLGVVFLEVHCGVRVLENAFQLCNVEAGPGLEREDAKRIRAGFELDGAAGDLLQALCRPEVRPLLPVTRPMLQGMLTVDLVERFRAAKIKEYEKILTNVDFEQLQWEERQMNEAIVAQRKARDKEFYKRMKDEQE